MGSFVLLLFGKHDASCKLDFFAFTTPESEYYSIFGVIYRTFFCSFDQNLENIGHTFIFAP